MTAFLLPLWSFTQDTVELSKIYERLRFWQYRAKTLEEKQLCMCFFVCFVSLSCCCCCYANNIVTSLCFCKISNTHLTTLNLLMHLLHSHVNWTGTICSQEMPRYNSFSGGKPQKRYKLAASCPFGDEQRLVGAFSAGCKWLPFYPFHLPGKEATGHHLFLHGINSFNWILR